MTQRMAVAEDQETSRSLWPNCSVDLKQAAALASMASLPLSVSLIDPNELSEILSKNVLFLHATMFGAATVFYYLRPRRFRCWLPMTFCAIFLDAGLFGPASFGGWMSYFWICLRCCIS
jgi:hypothetical protein